MLESAIYRAPPAAPSAPPGGARHWTRSTLQAVTFVLLGAVLPRATGCTERPAAPEVAYCPRDRAKPWVVWLVEPRDRTPRCAPETQSPALWSAGPVSAVSELLLAK